MAKKKIAVYGAGNRLLFSWCDLARCYEIASVADGDPGKAGRCFFGFRICGIGEMKCVAYDMLVVTPAESAGIRERLVEAGIEGHRIFGLQEALDMVPDDEWNPGTAAGCCGVAPECPAVAVVFYGGMGDFLIGREWLGKMTEACQADRSRFDIYTAGGLAEDGRRIFGDIIPKGNFYSIDSEKEGFFGGKTYDVVFRFCILPEVWSWRRPEGVPDSGFWFYVDRLDRYGKAHYRRGFFASEGFCGTVREHLVERQGVRYHTAYDIFGEFGEPGGSRGAMAGAEREEAYLAEAGLKGRRYVTLNTGLNREYLGKRNTRAWAFENWRQLALRIKESCPDLLVVQVGLRMRGEDDIPADVHRNGATDLEQAGILLKHALLHIDYDSGLVHLRHMTGGRSIVLMGPVAAEKHAYPENISVQAPACEPCEWMAQDWLSVCPRGYENPPCMESITVDMVAGIVMEEIGRMR